MSTESNNLKIGFIFFVFLNSVFLITHFNTFLK